MVNEPSYYHSISVRIYIFLIKKLKKRKNKMVSFLRDERLLAIWNSFSGFFPSPRDLFLRLRTCLSYWRICCRLWAWSLATRRWRAVYTFCWATFLPYLRMQLSETTSRILLGIVIRRKDTNGQWSAVGRLAARFLCLFLLNSRIISRGSFSSRESKAKARQK